MIHEAIKRAWSGNESPWSNRPPEPRRSRRRRSVPAHSIEATRFAEICAGLGGTAVLADLTPNMVTVAFGSRTDMIAGKLRELGWSYVGTGDWRGEPVLGVFFGNSGVASHKMEELAEDLVSVVAAMEVADTRLW